MIAINKIEPTMAAASLTQSEHQPVSTSWRVFSIRDEFYFIF